MKIKKILLTLGVATIAAMTFIGCSSTETTTDGAETTTESIEATTEEGTTEEDTTEENITEENIEETNSTDGVYRVEYAQSEENGLKTFLELTVEEGVVTNVNFDEVNTADDEADNALEQALLTATTPEEFEELINGQPEAEDFKRLITEALTQVEQGNKEITVVEK